MNTACDNYEIQEKHLESRLAFVEKEISDVKKTEDFLGKATLAFGVGMLIMTVKSPKAITLIPVVANEKTLQLVTGLWGMARERIMSWCFDHTIEELEKAKETLKEKLNEVLREQLVNGCNSEEKTLKARELQGKITEIERNIDTRTTGAAYDRVIRDIDSKPSFTFDKPFSP